MTQPQRKAFRLALILLGAVTLVAAGFGIHGATASAATLEAALASSAEGGALLASMPPPPNQDTCLSCHIAGENKNLWAPLGRWSVVSVFGLVFASPFGENKPT